MTSPLRVVDPHFHVWDLTTGNYPHFEPKPDTLEPAPATARSYLLDEYLGEGAGDVEVVKAVFVEAIPVNPVAEADYIQRLADESPIPLALVARADLSRPDAAAVLNRLAENRALRGIRQILNRHADPVLSYVDRDFMAEPGWRDGLALLKARGLSFDMQFYPHQMPAAAELVADHPDIGFIVNHAGMWADRHPAGWREWREGMRALARHDNVAVKISGLGMLDADWTLNSIRPLVYETLDAFGVERAMFASNFPVDKGTGTFTALWQAFADMVSSLSDDEQAALFSGNAERIYRI